MQAQCSLYTPHSNTYQLIIQKQNSTAYSKEMLLAHLGLSIQRHVQMPD